MILYIAGPLHHNNLILEWSQVASPGVGVSIVLSLLPKVASYVAIDNRLGQDDTLWTGHVMCTWE